MVTSGAERLRTVRIGQEIIQIGIVQFVEIDSRNAVVEQSTISYRDRGILSCQWTLEIFG